MTSATPWPPTALIVEDDPAMVGLLARFFRLDGYHVLTAGNGEHGLLEVSRNNPDIIILDLRMPIVGGLAFLRLLRARDRRNTPVAIVTGDTLIDKADLAELQHLGASIRFKPFWIEDLVDLAGQLLEAAGQHLRASQVPS